MLRKASVLAGVLFVGQVAFGQGEVVSFLLASGETAIAPSGGFVLTDVSASGDGSVHIQNGGTSVAIMELRPITANQHHWNSGIAFGAGDEIGYAGITAPITLSGYIPDPSGRSTIPAVGNVGLGILIATIAAAGGWVLSRRKGFARAA